MLTVIQNYVKELNKKEEEEKRTHLLNIVYNQSKNVQRIHCCLGKVCARLCRPFGNTSLRPSLKSTPPCVLGRPIFHFINERFSNLSPLVKDSPNWKKFEKRRVHNFSLGHGGNVREFGSPCPGCRFSCKKMKKQQSKTNVKNNKKDNKNKILE